MDGSPETSSKVDPVGISAIEQFRAGHITFAYIATCLSLIWTDPEVSGGL